MLKTLVVCGVAAVSAALAAQMVLSLDKDGNSGKAMAAIATVTRKPAPLPEPVAAGQPAQISKSRDGHYWAEARVNHSHVRFLVDTGATAVALAPADAIRLGFEPDKLSYSYKVMTASGEARAAKVNLETVSVAGAKVDDVEAYVIENGLDTSLLGMTYLGRLQRFEATQTALILRP